MNDEKSSPDVPARKTGSFMLRGIGLGIAIGAGAGVAMNNLPIGVACGIVIGMAIGAFIGRRKKM